MLDKTKPNIYIGASHGNESVMTGQDLEKLIVSNVNADICKDVKTYLFACATGVELGPKLVADGCPMYFGYQADFTFLYHPDYVGHPLDDPYAKAFFDKAVKTGESMLLGKSAPEIYNDTIDKYNYWWDFWLKQNDPIADDILTWLNWDRANFIGITPTGMFEGSHEQVKIGGLNIPSALLPIAGAGALLFLLSKS
jgi:hypothetical protein